MTRRDHRLHHQWHFLLLQSNRGVPVANPAVGMKAVIERHPSYQVVWRFQRKEMHRPHPGTIAAPLLLSFWAQTE